MSKNLALVQRMLQPETGNQLGQAFTNKLIENSQNTDGQFIPQKLAQQITKYGAPTIKQAVGPDGLANLQSSRLFLTGVFPIPISATSFLI